MVRSAVISVVYCAGVLLLAAPAMAASGRAGEHDFARDRTPASTGDVPGLIAGENDPRFAESEEGCPEGRVLDYLERHGDNGRIDPFALLERTREFQRVMERERATIRTNAIGGTVWTSIGPNNGAGRMVAVATDPTVAGTAIVGAAGGGAWKTTNSGASWSVLTDTIPNLSVGAIAMAPSAPANVYLGSGEGSMAIDSIPGIGLLYSSNGGTDWTLPDTVIATSFFKISVLPTNANELILATNVGAMRSTAGQNGPWTVVIPPGSTASAIGYGSITDLVRDPTNALVLYATTFDRNRWCAKFACSDPNRFSSPTVLKSVDGGQTWLPANTNLPVSTSAQMVNRMSIAISPSSPSTLYVGTSILISSTGVEKSHIYKTTDGGASWTETSLAANASSSINSYLGAQAWYDNTIVVAPNDANTVIAGGVRYVKTVDGGTTWTAPSGFNSVHVDAHDLRYDAGGTLYLANDGGVWTSTDHVATNASNRNSNLVTRQYYALATDPANRNRVMGGQQDNGTNRRPDAGGTSWDFFSGSDGFQCAIVGDAPSVAFSTTQRGNINRSGNAGAASVVISDVTPAYSTGESAPFFTVLSQDPSTPSTLYTATTRLWKTTSGGDAWIPLPITTTDGSTWNQSSIRAIAISKSDPLTILVAKANTIFRTTNGGTSWAGNPAGLPGKSVNGIEIDPTNPNIAYATFAGTTGASVYMTTNGGASWTARATGLPLFSALAVRFDPTDLNTLYCGTDVGVYRTTNGGANWSRFGTGMPAVSVYDLQMVRDGAIVRAATHGRGMWELTVTGNANHPPTASITAPVATIVAKGTPVSFTGTFTDADGGDTLTGRWTFPDDWSRGTTASGATVSHTFQRPGIFPVTLSTTDPSGASGAASADIIIPEPGNACSTPLIIPASGPFPYTVTVDTNASNTEATDPSPLSACYPFSAQTSVWLSFTPATSGTYQFSVCGSKVSGNVAGFTGNACGPYTAVPGACLANFSPGNDCATDSTASVTLTADVPLRLLVTNYFINDFGPVSLTVTQASAFTPVTLSVSPAVGSTGGGTPVIIRGSGFNAAATVKFDGIAATGVTFVNDRLLTAVTPVHAAGDVDVKVTNPGPAASTLGGAFTYVAPPIAAPTNVVATATSAVQIDVSWTAVGGAVSYLIQRNSGSGFADVTTIPGTTFSDTGRSPDTAYLYRVRAIAAGGGSSGDSNLDLATTTQFTNDPLVAGTTRISAVHITQLRTAVNAVRTLAGIGSFAFTDGSLAGFRVKAQHVDQLRTKLNEARTSLGLAASTFTNTLTAGTTPVRAIDITQVRNGTK